MYVAVISSAVLDNVFFTVIDDIIYCRVYEFLHLFESQESELEKSPAEENPILYEEGRKDQCETYQKTRTSVALSVKSKGFQG